MVQTGLKIDGRTLTRETLEAMRFLALDRMAEGESPAAISASFGMHRIWAYKVRLKARGRGKRPVRLWNALGRPRTLGANRPGSRRYPPMHGCVEVDQLRAC